MRNLLAAAFAACALCAHAEDGIELSLRSKSQAAAASSVAPRHAAAPFRTVRDPIPELRMREERERRGPRGSCEAAVSDLCYDLGEGRVVYRPIRRFMPAIEGLRAESISLRQDRVVFKYSFR